MDGELRGGNRGVGIEGVKNSVNEEGMEWGLEEGLDVLRIRWVELMESEGGKRGVV